MKTKTSRAREVGVFYMVYTLRRLVNRDVEPRIVLPPLGTQVLREAEWYGVRAWRDVRAVYNQLTGPQFFRVAP